MIFTIIRSPVNQLPDYRKPKNLRIAPIIPPGSVSDSCSGSVVGSGKRLRRSSAISEITRSSSGLFSKSGLRAALRIWSTSVSSSATTFAVRGSPVRRLISPKKSFAFNLRSIVGPEGVGT